MILRRDLDLAGLELLDRMVRTAVPELQFVSAAAHRQREDLVPEADPEDRDLFLHQLARVLDRVVENGRIPGAVAQEHTVGTGGKQIGGRRRRREHADVTAVRREPAQDVVLHAEVISRDLQRAAGVLALGYRREFIRGFRSPVKRRVAGYAE